MALQQENRRRLVKRAFLVGLPLLLLAAAGYQHFSGGGDGAGGGGGPPGMGGKGRGMGAGRPQPVSVAEVKQADLPVWLTALGTAVPRNLVTVRTRVDGQLMALHFVEGQAVKQGQLLAEIDPRPFQVQVAQAEGQMARDAALLQNAKVDLARYQDLWAKDSIARQQLDTQEALVRQYDGTVAADKGAVDNARLQLAYSRVTSPVAGRIGLRQVDPGNLVHASDANGIAVVAQVRPMTVVFSLPEAYLPELGRRLAEKAPVVVEAWDREQKHRLAAGRLLTIDNLVDTATGTIKLKAEFDNQDESLFPNQFANVRLLLGVRQGAVVVPGAAILRGAKGAFVYTADAEGKVASVPVTPGPENEGLVAVEGPLKPGARVVTDGADKLRDGAQVEVIVAGAKPGAPGATADGERKPGMKGKRRPEGAPPTRPGAPPAAAN